MKKLRLYFETTMFNYFFDTERDGHADTVRMFEPDDETNRLAGLYVSEGIVPAKYRLDSTHIACASVNGLDGVLSFNFQHINKLRTKEMTALVNLREGYKNMIICTPMEVLENEETEHD